MSTDLYYYKVLSPIGELTLVERNKKIFGLVFSHQWSKYKKLNKESGYVFIERKTALLRLAESQLHAYFAGKIKKFSLPLEFEGTEFQKSVWHVLSQIPFGKKISYSDQAQILGRVQAVRAVGSVNGKNPIPVLIPCHRVITKAGTLGGYSGGIEIKKFLLKLENGL